MPYVVEHITLPARFLATMAHLVATVTLIFDVTNVTLHASGNDMTNFDDKRSTLTGLAWASIACIILQFVLLFFGVTIFMPTVQAFHFSFHLIGCVLVALFIQFRWELKAYGWIFALFSCLPLVIEMAVAALVLQFKIIEYV